MRFFLIKHSSDISFNYGDEENKYGHLKSSTCFLDFYLRIIFVQLIWKRDRSLTLIRSPWLVPDKFFFIINEYKMWRKGGGVTYGVNTR